MVKQDTRTTTAMWSIHQADIERSALLANALGISRQAAQVLLNRNITTPEQAKLFLNPSLEHLPLPSIVSGLEKAVQTILEAVSSNRKILVYGDYDVDGVTGTVLLVRALRHLQARVDFYIPHRFYEGYGLNKAAVQTFAETEVDLIITVDCGISNTEEIAFARELGIDVVVLDHHNPPPVLPEATAIVDPKLGPAGSPYYFLAGVGVAYIFVTHLLKSAGATSLLLNNELLELVALGTISDIVPLLGENRVLTYHGLKYLTASTSPGIVNLKKIASLNDAITTYSVGFVLGPRLNAAGRLEHASISADLLLTENHRRAVFLSNALDGINERRKLIGEDIKTEILAYLRNSGNSMSKCITLARESWNPGIIGIVASQIARDFSRPVVLIALNNGRGKGSARSIANIDLYSCLAECRHLFVNFGGHREAAGFEIEADKVDEFISVFGEVVEAHINERDLLPLITIDAELRSDEITLKLAEELTRLEPFGQANPEPVFCTRQLYPIDFRLVGNGSHLSVTLSDGTRMIPAIGFGMASYVPVLHSPAVDIAYRLKTNTWKGKKQVQLQIVDITAAQ